MSTLSLKQSKILRESFKRFGRAGLSERVINLVEEFNKAPTYKRAIELAGRCRAIALAANADCYWSEKCTTGYQYEIDWLEDHKAETEKDAEGNITVKGFARAES